MAGTGAGGDASLGSDRGHRGARSARRRRSPSTRARDAGETRLGLAAEHGPARVAAGLRVGLHSHGQAVRRCARRAGGSPLASLSLFDLRREPRAEPGLVYLEADGVVAKTLPLMESAPTQEEQIHYAFVLRNLSSGWTLEERKRYFAWFQRAMALSGGHSSGASSAISATTRWRSSRRRRRSRSRPGSSTSRLRRRSSQRISPRDRARSGRSMSSHGSVPATEGAAISSAAQHVRRGAVFFLPPIPWRRRLGGPGSHRSGWPLQLARPARVHRGPQQGRLRPVPRDGVRDAGRPADHRPRREPRRRLLHREHENARSERDSPRGHAEDPGAPIRRRPR